MVDLAGRGQGRWSIRCVWACVDVGTEVRVVSASLPSLARGPGIHAGTTLQSVIPGGGRDDGAGGCRAEDFSSSFRREAGIQGHGRRRRHSHQGARVSAGLPSLALGPGIPAGTTLQSVIPAGGRNPVPWRAMSMLAPR